MALLKRAWTYSRAVLRGIALERSQIMFASKIARVVVLAVTLVVAGCAQLADLLGGSKPTARLSGPRVVLATIAPTPEEFLGGEVGKIRAKTPAPSATLAPGATSTQAPWTPEASATAVPWMPTPTPRPECEKYDGSTPTLRADLVEVRPGIDSWEFQAGCLGWGTKKYTIGDPRRVDLNPWGTRQVMSSRYDSVDGSLFVEASFGFNLWQNLLEPDNYWRWRFRLSRIVGRRAEFESVGKIVGDTVIGDGADPEIDGGFWPQLLSYAKVWTIPGWTPDVASTSIRTNSDGNPSGYDKAILSSSAAARWGSDTISIPCLPFEGVEPELLQIKTAVGNDVVLFGRGEKGWEYFAPCKYCTVRLEGHGKEDIPRGYFLLGTRDGRWGPVMDDLFPYPRYGTGIAWPRPRYIEQQDLFFFLELGGANRFFTFSPPALLKERKEIRYTCQ
ncbi:MAG: hypothetical protein Q8P56_01685 [Candidatus Uhrbacteria bacterium]|nr:hypothetical protein [Candidatus Uhrbacteria bacterium]